jgi:hypothetical protein
MGRRIALMLTLAAAGGLAQAAESQLQSAQRCAQIQDSLQRLVCYDRVFVPPAAAVVEPEQLGSEALKPPVAERKAEAPSRTFAAVVTDLRESRPNLYRIVLDNEQVWQQIDMDSGFHLTKGDSVQISRGALGGHFMTRTSRGGSSRVRVNRIR